MNLKIENAKRSAMLTEQATKSEGVVVFVISQDTKNPANFNLHTATNEDRARIAWTLEKIAEGIRMQIGRSSSGLILPIKG